MWEPCGEKIVDDISESRGISVEKLNQIADDMLTIDTDNWWKPAWWMD